MTSIEFQAMLSCLNNPEKFFNNFPEIGTFSNASLIRFGSNHP